MIPGIPHLQLKDFIKLTTPNPENLIANPSFEANLTGWTLQNSIITATLTRSSDIAAIEGQYIAKLSITAIR